MDIEYVKISVPDSIPVWFANDRKRSDSFSQRIASASFHYDEACQFIRRYFLSEAIRGRSFVDVGANIGTYAIAIAMLGVPTFAVEALPDNYVLLSAAIRKNGLRNVHAIHAAVTNKIGCVHLTGESAWGSISEQGIEVPGMTLDHLLQVTDLPPPAFLKIDVEGHEYEVLEGALDTISRTPDLDILIEVFPGHEQTLQLLEQQGFHLYMVN